MSKVRITVSVYGRAANPDRLAVAERYEDRARQSIDRRERAALYREADRIYQEGAR